jgi:hypothetical protein
LFSACRYQVFLAKFVEEAVFSPLDVLDIFVKNQVGIAVWIYICIFYSVPLVFMSVFVLVKMSFLHKWKIGRYNRSCWDWDQWEEGGYKERV